MQAEIEEPVPIPNLEHLLGLLRSNSPLPVVARRCEIKVAPESFARGELQAAFHARMAEECSGDDPGRELRVVVKLHEDHALAAQKESYVCELEKQVVASFLADGFNHAARHAGLSITLRYPQLLVASIELGGGVWYCNVEPLLEGRFEKWNNSTGRRGSWPC